MDILLRRDAQLRVLFVEPPADPLYDLSSLRAPALPKLRTISADRRHKALRPLKAFPRKAGPMADALLLAQVELGVRAMGLRRPTLWINDVTYAPLIRRKRWPSVYDVTDDWLFAPASESEIGRLRRLDTLALEAADEVVVCSAGLAASRGTQRPVTLIPNGVDVGHFQRPQPRPTDLPVAPVVIYVGSLHEARLDVDLLVEVAQLGNGINIVLVGPIALTRTSLCRLEEIPNILLLGPRPYAEVPGYLQHADAIIVPHLVSPFTESLDPIKAYECLTVDTPTVATPVAGFRQLGSEFDIVGRNDFAAHVKQAVLNKERFKHRQQPVSWDDRAAQFAALLSRAGSPCSPRRGG